MIVLGIDPGLTRTGFGILSISKNKPTLIDYGIIESNKNDSLSKRLFTIFSDVEKIIQTFSPTIISIEETFYGINVKSALLLGHSRGIPLLLSAKFKLSLHEFSARRIKQSLTGNGNASKVQVQFMVQKLLSMQEAPNPMDASDALAAAICYNQSFRLW